MVLGVLQIRVDCGGIHRYNARLHDTCQSDLLRYLAIGAGSVDHGKYFITFRYRANGRECHAHAGNCPRNDSVCYNR